MVAELCCVARHPVVQFRLYSISFRFTPNTNTPVGEDIILPSDKVRLISIPFRFTPNTNTPVGEDIILPSNRLTLHSIHAAFLFNRTCSFIIVSTFVENLRGTCAGTS